MGNSEWKMVDECQSLGVGIFVWWKCGNTLIFGRDKFLELGGVCGLRGAPLHFEHS
jgi:hypothetical protein